MKWNLGLKGKNFKVDGKGSFLPKDPLWKPFSVTLFFSLFLAAIRLSM